MTRSLFPALVALGLVAAACGPGEVEVSSPPVEELGFIRQVIDATMDSGAGLSVTSDAEGNPHLAYLRFERPPAEGEPPPQLDPLAPVVPVVMHAHLVGGVWTRTPVAQERDIGSADETAIAVDADGTHHVSWTEGAQIFYSSNAEGSFSEPERVVRADAVGIAMTETEGTPWISFYELQEDAEGPAALVRVATPGGEAWEIQTAAEADPGTPLATAIGIGNAGPIVAYNSAGRLLVASRSDEAWTSDEVDQGGLGLSMAVDEGGGPHFSYYDAAGAVRHAHGAIGAWEVSEVGDAGGPPEETWSTAIALAEGGVHYVAWQSADGLQYATNEGGSFEPMDVRASAAATRPVLAAGAEGDVFLGWYDTEELLLVVAVRTADEPLLAAPPGETQAPPQPPPGGNGGDGGPPPCEPSGTELSVVAAVGAAANGFESDCLAAPTGDAFSIDFDNQDEGVPHNVTIYPSQQAAASFSDPLGGAGGPANTIIGPEVTTYQVDALEEGIFFFQCDIHPTTMTGTFVVQ